MTFSLAVANVHNEPPVIKSVDHLDWVIFNEAGAGIRSALARDKRFYSMVGSGGAAVNPQWVRKSKFSDVRVVSNRRLMIGGRVGLKYANVSAALKRKHKGRRLGPSRYSTAVLATERASGARVIVIGSHLPARTQTVEKWRWPVMLLTLAALRKQMADLQRAYPGVPIIFGGDTNIRIGRTFVLPKGWREVAVPADFGRNRYSRIARLVMPRFTVVSKGEIRNGSDHDAPVVRVTLPRIVVKTPPQPPAEPERPTPPVSDCKCPCGSF